MKYIRIGIYILLIFFLGFSFLVFPRIIKVNKIECYNQYGLCSNEYTNKLNIVLGTSIDSSRKKISQEFKDNKLIEDYSVRFKIPSTLRVDMLLKKPKYALKNRNTNETVTLDDKGVVLESTDSTNLPLVLVSDSIPKIGETASSQKIFALELIYGIYYLYQVKVGEIVNSSLEVTIPNSGKVIFPLEGERDILLGSMKLILSRLNTDTNSPKIGKVKEIDLRYKNPVIRYE